VVFVSGMWEYLLAPHWIFSLVKTPLDWKLGLHGLVDGFGGLCWGFTPTCVNKEL
jgi:hypothetical protein